MTSLVWRKSSRSSEGSSGECVEVARLTDVIGVRDSKSPDAGRLTLETDRFAALLRRIKSDI
jgi:hypothetical protein